MVFLLEGKKAEAGSEDVWHIQVARKEELEKVGCTSRRSQSRVLIPVLRSWQLVKTFRSLWREHFHVDDLISVRGRA